MKKSNKYEIQGDKAILYLNRREGDDLLTYIDKDDLDRVLSKGTWFAEYHKDLKGYIVQNVSYHIINRKKKKKKISLQNFILDNYQDWIVVVKGKYFGRTKNKEEAEMLAKEKIKELMLYSMINEINKTKLNKLIGNYILLVYMVLNIFIKDNTKS